MTIRWLVLILLCACGKPSNDGGDDGGDTPDASQACVVDSDCGEDMKCAADGTCIGGCGGETLDLTYVPPSFMIVLDRSCSMDKVPAGATQTKWQSAVAALDQVLTDHATDIDWGLTLFPDKSGESCAQDAIPIPIATGNAPAIQTLLTGALQTGDPLFPSGPCVTNIDTALQQAALDPALGVANRSSFVMLVTDGAQSACNVGGGDAGSEAAIADLHTNRDVKTFVVGFGGGVDAAQLDRLALAGGAALAGTPKYYQADTTAQLDQVFQSIAELVVSCEYVVDPAPPDLAQTYVFFESSELVPRDPAHADGWDYDPATMTLRLYGSYCDRLQSRVVDDIDVVFGCPVPPLF